VRYRCGQVRDKAAGKTEKATDGEEQEEKKRGIFADLDLD
jgi:hypothetical protein